MEDNMKVTIQTLNSWGVVAAINAIFREDCTLDLATGLMLAEAGANRAAELVYTRCIFDQERDEALDDLCSMDDGDVDHLLRIAFHTALDACEAYYRDALSCRWV